MSVLTIVLLVAVVLMLFRVLYLEEWVRYWKDEAARQEMLMLLDDLNAEEEE